MSSTRQQLVLGRPLRKNSSVDSTAHARKLTDSRRFVTASRTDSSSSITNTTPGSVINVSRGDGDCECQSGSALRPRKGTNLSVVGLHYGATDGETHPYAMRLRG